MTMRCATTSPMSEPSLRISTRSLAVRLPLTLPITTTSRAVMLAVTAPLRPMLTRLPASEIDPSTRPSMNSDSEPVTSPLMVSDLPMLACSLLPAAQVREESGRELGVGTVLMLGFSVEEVGAGAGVDGDCDGFQIIRGGPQKFSRGSHYQVATSWPNPLWRPEAAAWPKTKARTAAADGGLTWSRPALLQIFRIVVEIFPRLGA